MLAIQISRFHYLQKLHMLLELHAQAVYASFINLFTNVSKPMTMQVLLTAHCFTKSPLTAQFSMDSCVLTISIPF